MKHGIPAAFVLSALIFSALSSAQNKPATSVPAYQGWSHSGSLTVLTAPGGANLLAGAVLEDFPLLVRLRKDWFDFK